MKITKLVIRNLSGHFESDDEVGSIFSSIKETIEELNQYIEEDTNAKKS